MHAHFVHFQSKFCDVKPTQPPMLARRLWWILLVKKDFRHPEVGSDPKGDLVPPPSG
jgi:hypothetical protein